MYKYVKNNKIKEIAFFFDIHLFPTIFVLTKCSGGGSGTILDYPLVDGTYGYSNVG